MTHTFHSPLAFPPCTFSWRRARGWAMRSFVPLPAALHSGRAAAANAIECLFEMRRVRASPHLLLALLPRLPRSISSTAARSKPMRLLSATSLVRPPVAAAAAAAAAPSSSAALYFPGEQPSPSFLFARQHSPRGSLFYFCVLCQTPPPFSGVGCAVFACSAAVVAFVRSAMFALLCLCRRLSVEPINPRRNFTKQ